MTAPTVIPGLCPCGAYASQQHVCEFRPAVSPEPAAHKAGMVHPSPVPGCPWCPPVACPGCGADCADPGECRRRWGASETTWRQQAGAQVAGSATYGRPRTGRRS